MEFQNSKMQVPELFAAEKTPVSAPKHFTFRELTRTGTGLDNLPEWDAVRNLRGLADFLDEVRGKFGGAVRVNSGYRSEAVNRAVGGVPGSAHTKGLAADICAADGTESGNRRLLETLAEYLPIVDQLIVYTREPGKQESPVRFIHVGLSDRKRPRSVMMWK